MPKKQEEIKNYLEELKEDEYKDDFSVLLAKETKQTYVNKMSQTLYPDFPSKDKYQVILVDPPWQYDTNIVPSLNPPYKTLSKGQLETLPIKEISDLNAVILMWSTGPMMS